MSLILQPKRWSMKPPPGARVRHGTSVTNGLVAQWLFNEAGGLYVKDSAGNYDGTIGLTTITWGAGKNGPALVAAATASAASGVGLPTGGISLLSNFTCEALIKVSSSTDAYSCIFCGTGNHSIFVRNSAGLFLDYYNSGDHLSSGQLTADTWTHIAVTYDAGTVSFYINGVAAGTATGQTSTFASFPILSLLNDTSAESLVGSIEYARVWGRSLSQAEVQRLFVDPYCTVQTQVPAIKAYFDSSSTVAVTENLSDTLSVSDAVTATYALKIGDNWNILALQFVDAVTTLVLDTAVFRSPSDTLSILDSINPLSVHFKGLSDSNVPTDGTGLTVAVFVPVAPEAVAYASTAPRIWTNDQITQWTNDGIVALAQDVNCIWDREALTVQYGISVITLPRYVRRLIRVTWRGKTLDNLSWEEFQSVTPNTVFITPGSTANLETSVSIPRYYSFHPTNPWDIRLYPAPNESFAPSQISDVYSPTPNENGCVAEYWRSSDTFNIRLQVPDYVLRRTLKAYVLWKAFASEGKGQDLKISKYYKAKYDFLIEKFRSINEGCFVGKKYSVDDGVLTIDGYRYPKPTLGPNFERVIF